MHPFGDGFAECGWPLDHDVGTELDQSARRVLHRHDGDDGPVPPGAVRYCDGREGVD